LVAYLIYSDISGDINNMDELEQKERIEKLEKCVKMFLSYNSDGKACWHEAMNLAMELFPTWMDEP
jgi:hypothetical protein